MYLCKSVTVWLCHRLKILIAAIIIISYPNIKKYITGYIIDYDNEEDRIKKFVRHGRIIGQDKNRLSHDMKLIQF